MLYSEIMSVCSEIHIKYINTVCGQNVELLTVKLFVHHVTVDFKRLNHKLLISDSLRHNSSVYSIYALLYEILKIVYFIYLYVVLYSHSLIISY